MSINSVPTSKPNSIGICGGDAAMDADTLGTKMNTSNNLQESWSTHRLPPPRGWTLRCVYFIIVSGSCTSIMDCIATLFIDLFSIAIILRSISYTLVYFSTAYRQKPKRNDDSRLLRTTGATVAQRIRTIPCCRPSPSLPLTTHFRLPSPLPERTCTCLESPALILGPSSLVHPARWNSIRTIQ
jgi:hypothetical protein